MNIFAIVYALLAQKKVPSRGQFWRKSVLAWRTYIVWYYSELILRFKNARLCRRSACIPSHDEVGGLVWNPLDTSRMHGVPSTVHSCMDTMPGHT